MMPVAGLSARLWRFLGRCPRWLFGVLAIVIVARLALPYAVRSYLNTQLSTPGVYQGRVEDVSLALWRGAYALEGVHLTVDRDGHGQQPLLDCPRMSLALSWRDLLRGRVVASLAFDRPTFLLVPAPTTDDRGGPVVDLPPSDHQPGAPLPSAKNTWQSRMQGLLAFRIDELRIDGGTFRYLDPGRDIELAITGIRARIFNLVGGADPAADQAPARAELEALTTGEGRLRFTADVRPWVEKPDFELAMSLVDVDLPALNPSTRFLDGLAFNRGRFSGFIELKAQDGEVEGLFKPLVHDLDVRRFNSSDGGISQLFWKAVVGIGEVLLVNDDTGALAARIPIRGRIDGPETDVWTVIFTLLSNAFITAIMPGFDDGPGAGGPRVTTPD